MRTAMKQYEVCSLLHTVNVDKTLQLSLPRLYKNYQLSTIMHQSKEGRVQNTVRHSLHIFYTFEAKGERDFLRDLKFPPFCPLLTT